LFQCSFYVFYLKTFNYLVCNIMLHWFLWSELGLSPRLFTFMVSVF
jgi:hypothetical protein